MTSTALRFPDRMNPTDALFWLMDKIPEMRSTIGALLILDHMPSYERVRDEYERLSHILVRMRQRVVEVPFGLAPPEWVEDPQFDLDYHLRYVAVPAPGGMDELLEEISPLYATAFDRDRPLWEAYLIEGLGGGRGAVFIKMHHCMTDGVGGAQLSEFLFGEQAPLREWRQEPRATRSTSPAALLWRSMLYNLGEAGKAGGALLAAAAAALRAPLQAVRTLRDSVPTVRGFGYELSASRADSPLHEQRSLSRQLSTFELALGDIDAVRAQLGATNNDIVLTIVSGAMHRWHTSRGADVRELRALVPVSLRAAEDAVAGNRLALLAVRLPVGQPNPLRRLRVIQERMGQVKKDRRAALYPVLARVMTAMPFALAERIGRQQTTRTNFTCTNVPGPRQTCYLAGAAIEQIYPYAPLVGDHPLSIALYSYRDTVCVGLDIDPLAMNDLPHFRDALRESYEEVLSVGRQAESSGQRRPARRRPVRGVRRLTRVSPMPA